MLTNSAVFALGPTCESSVGVSPCSTGCLVHRRLLRPSGGIPRIGCRRFPGGIPNGPTDNGNSRRCFRNLRRLAVFDRSTLERIMFLCRRCSPTTSSNAVVLDAAARASGKGNRCRGANPKRRTSRRQSRWTDGSATGLQAERSSPTCDPVVTVNVRHVCLG